MAVTCVLEWSVGVIERCEIDSVACSDSLNLLDPLLSYESPSLREGFEAALESESHAFE
jgi:hypothetical protein